MAEAADAPGSGWVHKALSGAPSVPGDWPCPDQDLLGWLGIAAQEHCSLGGGMTHSVCISCPVHRFLRRLLPWIERQRVGWRLRNWLLDPDRVRFPKHSILTALETGEKMWINPNDGMARYIFYRGLWEPVLARHFAAEVREGDTVLDVGANAGQYTVMAGHRVGSSGRVIAVEINPECLALLRRNCGLCHPARMDVLAVAAWSENTELQMVREDADATGLTSVRDGNDASGGDPWVTARQLDDALAEIGCLHADVVKLDIEGAELPALRGLSRMLRDAPPRAIYCEVENDHCAAFRYSGDGVFSYLERFGYTAFSFRRSDGTMIPRTGDMSERDYLNMYYFKSNSIQ
jgi:FkbM family methyltransferase